MADFENFMDYYAANFHQLKENDGLQFWREFVEKADSGLLKQAMDQLVEQYVNRQLSGKMQAAPKLAAFKAVYWRGYHTNQPKLAGCGKCHFGQVFCVMNSRTGYVADPSRVEPMDPLIEGVYTCSCDCSAGGNGGNAAHRRNCRENSFWELGEAQAYMLQASEAFHKLDFNTRKKVVANHKPVELSRYTAQDQPELLPDTWYNKQP